jgi:hypothetical protein
VYVGVTRAHIPGNCYQVHYKSVLYIGRTHEQAVHHGQDDAQQHCFNPSQDRQALYLKKNERCFFILHPMFQFLQRSSVFRSPMFIELEPCRE